MVHTLFPSLRLPLCERYLFTQRVQRLSGVQIIPGHALPRFKLIPRVERSMVGCLVINVIVCDDSGIRVSW